MILSSPVAPPNYPGTYWDLVVQAKATRPDHVILADDHGRSLNASEFHDGAEGVAAAFLELGIGPGTVVSWQLPTFLEALVTMAALTRLGAAQNPVIPILREREVQFITTQVGTEYFLVPETWTGFGYGDLARTLSAEQGFSVVIVDHDTDPASTRGALRLPTGDPSALPPVPTTTSAVRWLFHSSGTTADPKGAQHTDASIMAGATGMIVNLDSRAHDIYPIAFPVSHIGGVCTLTTALMTGMRLVLFEAFERGAVGERIAAHRPTRLGSAVPFFLEYIDAQKRHGDELLFPDLELCCGGGAPMPPEVCRDVREHLGGIGIVNSWGLTEFPVATFATPTSTTEALDNTVGPVVPGVEARIVRANGSNVGRGEEGELRLKGLQCMVGYIDTTMNVDAFDADGWFRTGDLGIADEHGNIRVTGRLKDIVIRNAENISALEVEDAVFEHPAVREVAVIGVPDPRTGERVCAVIVPEGEASPTVEVLAEHCRGIGLAKWKWPERVELVSALPRTPMGKIKKDVLRADVLGSEKESLTDPNPF